MKRLYPPGMRVKEKTLPEIDPSSLGLNYENVSFYTRKCKDVVLLRGWYIPSENSKKCIVMVHGIRTNKAHTDANLLEIAKALVGHGFNVLTFDLRAHGESEGNHISLGYFEAYDALGAFDFLVNKKNILPKNIGMIGFSYGALIIILAAKKTSIRAVVMDSCPGDTLKLTKRWMLILHIPPFFFYLARLGMKLIFGIDSDELKTKEVVRKILSPVFFIHGTEDEFPYTDVRELYEAKYINVLDDIWIVEGAGHLCSYPFYPEEYIKKITIFFDKAFKAP